MGMAALAIRGGRPYKVAIMPIQTDYEVQLRQAFYEACAGFNYTDVMAVSRRLGVTSVTVYNWKYRMCFPSWNTALQVIFWVQEGKPSELVKPAKASVSML